MSKMRIALKQKRSSSDFLAQLNSRAGSGVHSRKRVRNVDPARHLQRRQSKRPRSRTVAWKETAKGRPWRSRQSTPCPRKAQRPRRQTSRTPRATIVMGARSMPQPRKVTPRKPQTRQGGRSAARRRKLSRVSLAQLASRARRRNAFLHTDHARAPAQAVSDRAEKLRVQFLCLRNDMGSTRANHPTCQPELVS